MVLSLKQQTYLDRGALPTIDNDTLMPFDLPAAARKKMTTVFDGGRFT
jgi:hypothetical protein